MSKWMPRAWWCATVAVLALAASDARAAEARPLKIGIIGAGKIGGTLAALWARAGHEVLVSSRHPDELRGLAQSIGPKARVGVRQGRARRPR